MGRENRNAHGLNKIGSMRELRVARRELEIREWFARERLADDAAEVFSLGTLVSLIAPRGSILGGMAGGIGRVFSAALAAVVGRGAATADKTVDKTAIRAKRSVAATKAVKTKTARTAKAAQAVKAAGRKRAPEIVVEVEPDPPAKS